MNPLALALAVGIAVAAVAAVAARDGRAGLSGLLLVLALGPILADPLPTPAALALREVAALLAVVLLRATVTARLGGSRLGWPAETLIAGAAWVGGLSIGISITSGLLGAADPSSVGLAERMTPRVLAMAAGAATLALGLRPVFGFGDSARATTGLLVAVAGLVLLRTGLAGSPGEVEQLALVGFIVAVAASGTAIAHAAERR